MAVPIQSRCSICLWFLEKHVSLVAEWGISLLGRRCQTKYSNSPAGFSGVKGASTGCLPCKKPVSALVYRASVWHRSSSQQVEKRWMIRGRPSWSIPLLGHKSSAHTLVLLPSPSVSAQSVLSTSVLSAISSCRSWEATLVARMKFTLVQHPSGIWGLSSQSWT